MTLPLFKQTLDVIFELVDSPDVDLDDVYDVIDAPTSDDAGIEELFAWRCDLKKIASCVSVLVRLVDAQLIDQLGPSGRARFGDQIVKVTHEEKRTIDVDKLVEEVRLDKHDIAMLFRLNSDNFRKRSARALSEREGWDPSHIEDIYTTVTDVRDKIVVVAMVTASKRDQALRDGEVQS